MGTCPLPVKRAIKRWMMGMEEEEFYACHWQVVGTDTIRKTGPWPGETWVAVGAVTE